MAKEKYTAKESHISVSRVKDGYSRVLFVGTTGAGKTSLLRQLIGSDPDEDRFPSTAPAKTTIADIEVIQAEAEFEAAVTFFSEFQTQANIEECIADAALAVFEKAPVDKVADRFLNHRDQKFRLAYILGSWTKEDTNATEDEMSFDERDEPLLRPDTNVLDESERAANHELVEGYLARITSLAQSVVSNLEEELGVDLHKGGPDQDAAKELIEESFESRLTQEEAFHEIVQDILEAVRSRFDYVEAGELLRRRSGWPELWLFKSEDRDDFIRQIRWFSSNYSPQFGRLLTPLVDGIRIRGPLFTEFVEGEPKLVLIDGQGLGHSPESAASITTRVTRKFASVDVILLVDNAQQPMQAAPLSVLRAVISSGHHEQGIDHATRHRLRQFEAFVASTVERELRQIRETFVGLRKNFTDLATRPESVKETLDEIAIEDEPVANAIAAALASNENRRLAVAKALLRDEDLAPDCPSLASVAEQTDVLAKQIEARIQALRITSADESRKRTGAEANELRARKWLATRQQAVLDDIERRKRYAAYSLCIEETRTHAITQKSTAVTKIAVSQKLKRSFRDELANLAFHHVEVELKEVGGTEGVLYHKLILTRAPGVELPKVVSEGEQRCLSIAAFFAELSTADDRSGIVFDDPVSSLDYRWREAVARRLVQEARSRQVIVFTHNIVFLLLLKQFAEEFQSPNLTSTCGISLRAQVSAQTNCLGSRCQLERKSDT